MNINDFNCINIKNNKTTDKQCNHKKKYGDFCGIHNRCKKKIIYKYISIDTIQPNIKPSNKKLDAKKLDNDYYTFGNIIKNNNNVVGNNDNYIDIDKLTIKKLINTVNKFYITLNDTRNIKLYIWNKLYLFCTNIIYFTQFETNIIKIQSHIRKKLIYNRLNTINEFDLLTCENAFETTGNHYFYIIDDINKKYWFDISTFNKLIDDCLNNPYSTNLIDTKTKKRFLKMLNYYDKFKNNKLNTSIIAPKLSIDQEFRDLALRTFQKINKLDNYADFQWFLNLNLNSLHNFYKIIEDIWNWRSQLTPLVQNRITNNTKVFGVSNIIIFKITDKRYLQNLLLDDFNILIDSAIDISDKKLGAMYILIALSEVSYEASCGLPQYAQSNFM